MVRLVRSYRSAGVTVGRVDPAQRSGECVASCGSPCVNLGGMTLAEPGSTGFVALAQRAVIQQIRWLLVAFRRLDQRNGQRNMCPAIAAALWSSRSRISRWTVSYTHLTLPTKRI